MIRLAEEKLAKIATEFPVLAITGPRQSDKTTLCKKAKVSHLIIV